MCRFELTPGRIAFAKEVTAHPSVFRRVNPAATTAQDFVEPIEQRYRTRALVSKIQRQGETLTPEAQPTGRALGPVILQHRQERSLAGGADFV